MGAHDGTIAVAVSGGSDSLALMHLLRGFAQQRKSRSLVVLTVDHGLRKFSARDAKQVAAWAKQAGLKAKILTWTGAKPKSGIEAAAREARYRLMGVTGHHDNCADNLRAAISPFGIALHHIPTPLNLFMNTRFNNHRDMVVEAPEPALGASVTFRALRDCVMVFSACPQDLIPVNAHGCTPQSVAYQVLD